MSKACKQSFLKLESEVFSLKFLLTPSHIIFLFSTLEKSSNVKR